jgi:hypothetical protein
MVALPKLNNTPQYSLTIPSINKKVYYRPYLVQEEKVLLMASESEDPSHMFKSLVNTVNACIQDDISKEELTVFDVEYIFTQLRSKSSGENIKFKPKCNACSAENDVSFSLEDVKVDMPDIDPLIKLTDTISIKMKWPSYKSLFGDKDMSKLNESEQAFALINQCIDSVITEEESISVKDVSEKELNDFVGSLTSDQFKLIRNYIDKIPKLKHDINYECKECGEHNSIHVEGLKDFF